MGNIIAWILKYRDISDDDGKQASKNNIFGLIERMFKNRSFNSHKEIFLAEFYRKLMEYDNNNDKNQSGLCDIVIIQIISAFEDESITHDKAIDYLDYVLQTIPLTPSGDLQSKHKILRQLYLQTLDELSENVRRMVMHHDKSFFENKLLMSQPPKEWSKIREENITNYNTIIACGICKNKDCPHYNHYATAICDYYSFISAMSLCADNSYYSEMECPACKTQRSFHIYNTMNDLVNGIMNKSF